MSGTTASGATNGATGGPTVYGTTIDDAVRVAGWTHPYYHRALSRLRLVPDDRVPTMATSAQWVTHYNPATVATWTPDEAGAVLVHELEHLLRDHAGRCGDRDHGRFNVAADAEINQRLAGLPDGAVYPESFGLPRGRTAEVYYGAMPGQPDGDPGDDGDAGDGEPGDGDGSGSGSGAGQPGQGSGSGEPGDGAGQPGQGSGSGQPGDGPDCGSAAGGETREWERGDAANPGAGAADPDAIRRLVARDVLSGQYGSPGQGDGDGDELRDWAETALGIDRSRWYTALSSAVGHTLSSVGAPTRWTWPGRRDMRDMGGAMLPRWTGERPSCAVIIDTSSSISAGDLDMARAAGHYLGRLADVTYYGCNTLPTLYGPTLPDRIRGGGGTNLVTGIERAIEDGARAIVIITDCETPWPAYPTHVPLIIGANVGARDVLARGPRSSWYPPEWATVIPIIDPD